MAIMNKMREKMTVIFAGLAGAFLLMIIFEWGAQGDFFKSGRKPDEIGVVNGASITNKDYDNLLQQVRQQKLQEVKKTTLTETEENEVREKAWDQVVVSKLIEQKIDEFGIIVTDQEVRDVLFYNPPEYLKRNFTDSLGRFDEAAYFQALRDPRNDTTVSDVSSKLREDLKRQKLSNMLQGAIRTTRAEMWDNFEKEKAKATIEMIKMLPTQDPRDFLSKITEEEIKKYYEDHSFLYKREEGRKIKFVVFRELPTPKDSIMLMERMESLKKKWMALPLTAPDSAINDLSHDYTDLGYQPAQTLAPPALREFQNSEDILNAKVGDVVVGVTQGSLKVIRILEQQDSGAMFVKTKQILIGFGTSQNKDSAKTLALKLLSDLKAGGDFAETAHQYSQDVSAREGGDMPWFGPKMMDPAYEQVGLNAPIGELQGPVESQRGYHIIMVTGRSRRNSKVGTIPIEIRSSSKTTNMVQQQANIFRAKAVKDGFDQAAESQGIHVISDGPLMMKKGMQPMFGHKPWVDYVFELSAGEITQPVRIPNMHLIAVAQITEVIPAGVKPLDSTIKEQIKRSLVKRKAIEALAPKAKELRAKLNAGDNLSKVTALDSAYRPVQVTFGPAESAPNLGTEYAVNNAAFAMKQGEISQPIEGENGYYIIKVLDIKPADKQQYEIQKTKEFEALNQEKQRRFFSGWLEELKEKAKVIDYRSHRM